MGDDDDGVILFEFLRELLDLARGDGVERGSGLVHQKDVGLYRKGAGYAQPLLLPAREPERALFQAILEFIPDGCPAEGALDDVIELRLFPHAVGLGTQSIRRLKKMEADIENADKLGLTKKEVGIMTKEVEKLRDIFGGILEMHGIPQAMIVIDVPREINAVREAKNLDIPTIAICDTNANPELVDYPVPGNDDAARATQLYCDLFVDAILSGIEKRLGGAAGKKVESDMADAAAEDFEADIKDKEARQKSKKSEARAERREKLVEKAEKATKTEKADK